MNGDVDLRATLHRTVAEKLSEHLRSLDDDHPLSLDDEQALTRSLIAAELRRLAEDAYRNGQAPLDAETESELADAVFDRVHGLGRLQPYIDDPDLARVGPGGHPGTTLSPAWPALHPDYRLFGQVTSRTRYQIYTPTAESESASTNAPQKLS